MKKLIFAIATIVLSASAFSSAAYARRTINVRGHGQYNDYCDPRNNYSCINNVKYRAEQYAEQDARWTCEGSYHGRALTYTRSFYTNCNPNYIPPGSRPVMVLCTSDADMDCEIDQ
jgi:hypothetical protein